MMEYALINLSSNEMLERRQFEDTPPNISHKGVNWLPLEVIRPGCDLNFQEELPPVTTVTDDRVIITYTVRSLTKEELDQKKLTAAEQDLFGPGKYTGTALLLVLNQQRAAQNLQPVSKFEFLNQIVDSLSPPETELNQEV